MSRLRISRVLLASCLSCDNVSDILYVFYLVFTISREPKGTPESRFNLDEAVTKMAKSFKPLVETYATKIRVESIVNHNAYVFKVGVLQIDGLLYEIMPGCTYPSERPTKTGTSNAPKKPMVALNSW